MSFKPALAFLALALSLAASVSAGPLPKAHAVPAKAAPAQAAAAAPAAPAASAPAAAADPAAPAAEPTEATKVYLAKTGTRYHNKGCRYLKGAEKEITIGDAMKKGYAPCNVCKAPRVKR